MKNERKNISRVIRTRAETEAAYTQMSRWYHRMIDPLERRYRQAGLRLLALQAGEHVLDIGCGTGEGLRAMAEAVGHSGTVTGIDLAAGMLRVADRLLTEAGLRAWATLVRGDAAHMPFPDAVFEAAFMSFTLELFDTGEIPVVLAECRRVLRPGGRLCVVAMAKTESPGMMLRLYEWAHRVSPAVVDCRPIFPADALAQAEFRVQAIERLYTFGLPVDIVLAERAPGYG